MTSPTPIDGLVWSYHQLGWSTRRIAGEVQTSQASVVRILERLKKDPPTTESMALVNITPQSGFPAVNDMSPAYGDDEHIVPRHVSIGTPILIILTLVLLGALGATLAAANGGLIARGKPGVTGPAGPVGPQGPKRDFKLCVRYSQYSGAIVSLTAPVKGSCGTATMVKIPG